MEKQILKILVDNIKYWNELDTAGVKAAAKEISKLKLSKERVIKVLRDNTIYSNDVHGWVINNLESIASELTNNNDLYERD